jgi:hypothetical protein
MAHLWIHRRGGLVLGNVEHEVNKGSPLKPDYWVRLAATQGVGIASRHRHDARRHEELISRSKLTFDNHYLLSIACAKSGTANAEE